MTREPADQPWNRERSGGQGRSLRRHLHFPWAAMVYLLATVRKVYTDVKMRNLGGRGRVFEALGIRRGCSRGVAAILPDYPSCLISHGQPLSG